MLLIFPLSLSPQKISSKNAFGLHLIDHMLKLLKMRGEMTNFQVQYPPPLSHPEINMVQYFSQTMFWMTIVSENFSTSKN